MNKATTADLIEKATLETDGLIRAGRLSARQADRFVELYFATPVVLEQRSPGWRRFPSAFASSGPRVVPMRRGGP